MIRRIIIFILLSLWINAHYTCIFILLLLLCIYIYIYIIVWKPKYSSIGAGIINAFSNKDNIIITVFYAISGFVLVQSYFTLLHNEAYTSKWYNYPPGHRGYSRELNEENLFISWFGLVLGAWFSINRILDDKNILEISPFQQPIISAIKVSMPTMIHRSSRRAFRTGAFCYITFIFFNGILYYLVARFFDLWASNLLATPVIGFRWYDVYLLLRVWLSGIYVTLGFEMMDRVFDIYYGIIPHFSIKEDTRPFDCLLNGLKEDNGLIRSLAYAELAHLSRKQPHRRIQLFNDTNHDFSKSSWKNLTNECMTTLNDLRKRLVHEYPTTSTNNHQQQQKYQHQIRFSYQSSSFTERDANGLDDRTTGLFVSYSTPNETYQSDSLWMNKNISNNNKTSAQKTTYQIIQSLFNLKYKFKQWKWAKKFFIITREQKMRTLFYDTPDVIHAIQVLGSLTSSSFNEDPYGYVHRDLDIVLNTLMGTLSDVNQFIRSPPSALLDETEAITKALQDSIYTIALTFKDHLHEIKVDKKYQHFLKHLL
ncbi:nucleoporin protein Ndc1-Nup [Cunninghamella echinulata]|nr:nucleoporin protein Ndc1-Nup [Cunninghamella echinulata]